MSRREYEAVELSYGMLRKRIAELIEEQPLQNIGSCYLNKIVWSIQNEMDSILEQLSNQLK